MKPVLFAAGLSLLAATFTQAHAEETQPRRRALVLGLDGTSGFLLEKRALQDKRAPAFASLMSQGVYAACGDSRDPHCARTHAGPRHDPRYEWVTGPGWAAVLSGADTQHHRVRSNGHELLSAFYQATRTYPSFLRSLHEAGFVTAAAGTGAFITAHDGPGVYHGVTDYECGFDGVGPLVDTDASASCNLDHRYSLASDDPARDDKATQWLVDLMEAGQADVLMAVFDLIDSAGHGAGYDDNPSYMAAISDADARLAKLTKAIARRVRTHHEEWLVVVTSDHGGHSFAEGGGGHDRVHGVDEAIPFIVASFSPRVLRQRELVYPVTQMDVKPSLLAWFGQVPQASDGRVQVVATHP